MERPGELWRRLVFLFRRRSFDRDLEDEMRFHLDRKAQRNRESGMSAEDARHAARRQFGNATLLKESSREMWGWRVVEDLLRDLKFALRTMAKNRGFTAVPVLTLALGLGATTGILSVVNSVLFRPLPYPESERLMVLLATFEDEKGQARTPGVSPLDFLIWREHSRSFEQISAARPSSPLLTGSGEPRRLSGAAANFDLFQLLGVSPIRGRTFTPEEDQPGHDTVALLGSEFWHREFGGDPAVVGRSMQLDGRSRTVVGVLPPGVRFADFGPIDVWTPLAAAPARNYFTLVAVGRLRAGVSPQAAQAELRNVASTTAAYVGDLGHKPRGAVVTPFRQWMVGDARTAFLLVLGAACFILLICCANIATLLTARAAARQPEMTVRRSLGAGRSRIVRQLVSESVLLAAMGGTLGLLFTAIIVRAVPAIQVLYIPRAHEIRLDWQVLSIAALLSLGTGILFGLGPVLEVSRTKPARVRGSSHGLRDALVVAQVALSLVLLAGAGLLLSSYLRLLHLDLGFQPARLLTVRLAGQRPGPEVAREIAQRVEHLPGVQGASFCNSPPLQATLFTVQLSPEGRRQERLEAEIRFVDEKYFQVAGIPVRLGRDFEPPDDARRPTPGVVNEAVSGRLRLGENPLGRLLATGYKWDPVEVVGVTGDSRQLGLKTDPGLQIYLPLSLNYPSSLIVRADAGARFLPNVVRGIVREFAPNSPAPAIQWMDERIDEQLALPRFYLALFGAFALAGLLLAGVGTYGVLAYSVAERTHDIGIRMALGATRSGILRMVTGRGALLACLGGALGLAGALALARFLEKLLYGVRPNDPVTLICASLLLIAVAAVASYIPARRAARVDPMAALRHE